MAFLALVALLGSASLGAYVVQRDGLVNVPPWPAPPMAPDRCRRLRLAALVAAVGVPVVSTWYFTADSGFFWDDLVNFRQAQVQGFSLHYLLEPTSAHFAPGHRLGDWLVQTFFPMNFSVAHALMMLGFAVALVTFHRLLAELFGPGPGPLLLTFGFGTSVVQMGTLNWWASSLDRLPATILTFVSILAYVRFFRTGSRRSLALSVVAMTAALLFFVKPVFVPLYLVLLRVLVLQPRVPVRESLAATLREWRIWLLYVAPLALYGIVYTRGYTTLQHPTLKQVTDYVSLSWLRVAAPSFLGIYIPKHTPSGTATAVAIAVQALLAAVVVLTVRRRRAAGRAWLFFAITFLANTVVVGVTRVGLFTPKFIAYVLDFHLESTYLFFIALGAAVMSPRTEEAPPPAPTLEAGPGLFAGPGRVVLATALAAYLALGWWNAAAVRREYTWFGTPSRQFTDAAGHALEEARAGRQSLVLVDGTVPNAVVPAIAGYYNSQSQVLPLLDDHLSFDAPGRELFEVSGTGAVRPVVFTPLAGGDTRQLLGGSSALVTGASSVTASEAGLCVKAGDNPAILVYTPPKPLVGDHWYLALEVSSAVDVPLGILPEDVGGHRPATARLALVADRTPRARHVFPLDTTSLKRIYIAVAARVDACFGDLEVGRVVAR